MPELTPVDGDPFNDVTLTPVEHDPFALDRFGPGGGLPWYSSSPPAPPGPPPPAARDVPDYSEPQPIMAGEPAIPIGTATGIVKNFASGLRNFLGTPGDVAQQPMVAPATPGQWTEEDQARANAAIARATNWGPQTALQMVGGGAPGAEAGAAGIFGGRLAKTADLAALARAEDMAKAGAAREDIWNQTGWFQGADQKWRFEIPDQNVGVFGLTPEQASSRVQPSGELSREIVGRENRGLRVSDLVQHPDLFEAYPAGAGSDRPIAELPAVVRPMQPDMRGSYDRTFGHVTINETLDPWDARSTALHELQHDVQHREGFTPGASPQAYEQSRDLFRRYLDALGARDALDAWNAENPGKFASNADIVGKYKEQWDSALNSGFTRYPDDDAINLARNVPRDTLQRTVNRYSAMAGGGLPNNMNPADMYYRTAGEVEARNVQRRKDMTPQMRRDNPPWTTEEVLPQAQIVRSSTPLDLDASTSSSVLPMDEASRMARAAEQGYTIDAYKGMYPYDWRTVPERYGNGRVVPGTENRIPQEITESDASRTGLSSPASGAGFFSHDPAVASRFADAMGGGAVYPVKIKMQNPKVIDAQGRFAADFQFGPGAGQLKLPDNSPHDGVIMKNTKDEGDVYIPREPHQIRSRFAAFDPANAARGHLLGSGAMHPALSAAFSAMNISPLLLPVDHNPFAAQ